MESRRRHEDAGSSARLKMILQGCERSDSTQDDGPEVIQTPPEKMLDLKAVKESKVIHEWPKDTHCERPQPMSRIRKLSDNGLCCQLGGIGILSGESWICSYLMAKFYKHYM